MFGLGDAKDTFQQLLGERNLYFSNIQLKFFMK